MRRPGMTVEKLDTILARQLPQAEKKSQADYLFDTGVPLEQTRQEVAELVRSLAATQEQQ